MSILPTIPVALTPEASAATLNDVSLPCLSEQDIMITYDPDVKRGNSIQRKVAQNQQNFQAN